MARPDRDVRPERGEGRGPRQAPEGTVYRRAATGEQVGYTPAEYGVRKDDGLGIIKPVNSSRGLLVLAVLVTIAFAGMLYGLVQIAITGQWHILGDIWWMYLLILVPLLAGWSGYFKERRAERLRRARNLPRPVE